MLILSYESLKNNGVYHKRLLVLKNIDDSEGLAVPLESSRCLMQSSNSSVTAGPAQPLITFRIVSDSAQLLFNEEPSD
jgi:hypothetical protein